MEISKDIIYIGVNDTVTDLFESQYRIPNGISYNSYLILDERVAVMDTVDARFTDEWLENLESALGGRTPDYLIIHHMEPDHSANITTFKAKYPNATVVASAKAFDMMGAFFGNDFSDNRIIVTDGYKLNLGTHTLSFLTAPMVHWPEVIMSYDSPLRTTQASSRVPPRRHHTIYLAGRSVSSRNWSSSPQRHTSWMRHAMPAPDS